MSESSPQPPLSKPARTVRRILAEAFFVAFVGALFFGLGEELRFQTVGLILAVVIWVLGTPALEIARVMQMKK